MANTFKRYTLNNLGTSTTIVMTATKPTIIIGGIVATVGGNDVKVTISIDKLSSGSGLINIVGHQTLVPGNSALSFIDGKVVLEASDRIRAFADIEG